VNVTFITIVVLAAVSAILDISFITDGDLLELLQAGFAGKPIDEAWVTEIMDSRRTMINSLSDSIASALLVTYFISAISFLTWFYRAYKNLEFGGFPLKHKSSWTVVGFMIPILNLRRPFDMMEELSSASTTLSRGEELSTGKWLATSRLIILWWGLFLTMSQSGIVQERLFGEIDQFDEFLKSLWFSLAMDLLLVVAAIITLLLVRRIHTLQERVRVKYGDLERTLAYTPQTRYSQ
jgi:amino acid transporter